MDDRLRLPEDGFLLCKQVEQADPSVQPICYEGLGSSGTSWPWQHLEDAKVIAEEYGIILDYRGAYWTKEERAERTEEKIREGQKGIDDSTPQIYCSRPNTSRFRLWQDL